MRVVPGLALLVASVSQAQVLLEEPFNVFPANNGWSSQMLPTGGADQVISGAWVVDTIPSGTGIANLSPCFRKEFDAGLADISVRYWVSGTTANAPGGAFTRSSSSQPPTRSPRRS